MGVYMLNLAMPRCSCASDVRGATPVQVMTEGQHWLEASKKKDPAKLGLFVFLVPSKWMLHSEMG